MFKFRVEGTGTSGLSLYLGTDLFLASRYNMRGLEKSYTDSG